MKPLDSRAVDAATVQWLLVNKNGRVDATQSQGSTYRTYVLNDGSALVVASNGTGRHWTSYSDLVERCRELEEAAKIAEGSVFTDLFPSGKDFIDRLPQIAAALPRLLNVEASTLDATESSMNAIDAAIETSGSERFLDGEVFQSLVAYVGEVIRRDIGGRWELVSHDDGRTWEPDVIDSRGNRCNLLRVYKEILEHGEEGNLRAFGRHTIRTHRREGPV